MPLVQFMPTGHWLFWLQVATQAPLLQVRLPPPCMVGQSALLPHIVLWIAI